MSSKTGIAERPSPARSRLFFPAWFLMSSPALIAGPATALRLSAPWGEHMVLQSGQPSILSGSAAPGAQLEIELAGHKAGAVADGQGSWQAALPALAPGGPYALKVVSGSERIEFSDILAGEVWLASGQSNMEWPLSKTKDAATELPQASHPRLRLFNAAHTTDSLQGSWSVSDPDSAANFSAVAWHFGAGLQKRLKVPVGLIASCWSGTNGETWTPSEAVSPAIQARWAARPEAEKQMYRKGWDFHLQFKDLTLVLQDGSRHPMNLMPWACFQAEGSVSRCEAGHYFGNLKPGAWGAAHAALSADLLPQDLRQAAAIEFKAKGNSSFDLALGQPSIQDGDNYCLPLFKCDKTLRSFRFELKDLKQQGWGLGRPLTLDKIEGILFRVHAPNQFPDQPGLLFDSMIRPLKGMKIKGAIWYQGESNVERSGEYAGLLQSLVKGWRKALDLPDLDFIVVQLPEFGGADQNSLTALRAAQERILELPHTGLVKTIGLGDWNDIHPKDKKPVGKLLAQEAMDKFYKVKN